MRVKFQIWLQIAVLAMAVAFPWVGAKAQGGSLQSQLEAQYTLTKPTDDKSDIVTAGAVLILEKDKLIMYPTTNQVVPQNTYKDGKALRRSFWRASQGAEFWQLHRPSAAGPGASDAADFCNRRKILGNED